MNIIEKLNEARKYYKDSYGIYLNKKQLKVLNSKDEVVREIFERAEGCSTAAMIKAIEFAINNERSTVLFINANRNISAMRIDDMKNMLSNKNLERHILSITKNQGTINFINGSQIKVISGNTISMIGLRADCIIVEPIRIFNQDFINDLFYINAHSNRRQTVLLNQVDLFNGQPINI